MGLSTTGGYPISQKPSHQLSWSRYLELLKLDDDPERGIYKKQTIAERRSVPELKRQKYQLYLPDLEALRRELELTLREAEA